MDEVFITMDQSIPIGVGGIPFVPMMIAIGQVVVVGVGIVGSVR